MSPLLKNFYVAYAKWLAEGAPDNKPFSRATGLCSNLYDYVHPDLSGEASKQLHEQFEVAGLHLTLPFNHDETAYHREQDTRTCHLNSQRIAWVQWMVML